MKKKPNLEAGEISAPAVPEESGKPPRKLTKESYEVGKFLVIPAGLDVADVLNEAFCYLDVAEGLAGDAVSCCDGDKNRECAIWYCTQIAKGLLRVAL